jgi:integrase
MPRAATGTVESRPWRDGRTVTWRLRVRAGGRRHPIVLGTNHEGWSRERATAELERILARIERGTWEPPLADADRDSIPSPPTEALEVTLARWWQRKQRELRPATVRDYRWRIDYVLAFGADRVTASIDARWVDEFRSVLERQRTGHGRLLSARSINMVLDLLAAVLDDAVRYGLLDFNPARAKGTRLKVPKGSRSFLEPDMVLDLLDAAGEWEAELPPHQHYGRRALLALLCLGGPRIGEAIRAERGDFDLTSERWRIPDSKTEAGQRTVELSAFCAAEIRAHAAAAASRGRPLTARSPMWPTATGGHLNPTNIRLRLLAEAVIRANERRGEQGKMLLPAITPHALRRTFASLCFFAGRDLRFVMAQLGHADPRMTLGVYAQTVQRRRLDRDLLWRLMRFADEPAEAPHAHRLGY